VRSGGSSTKPLIFPVDIQENLYQRKLLAIELVKYGMFSSTTIAINLFSYKGMYRTAAIVDDVLEKCNATTISLGASSSFELAYNSAIQFKGNMLMGTPSKLTLFANYIIDNNLILKVDNLMYAGEFLLASQVKLLKKAFNIKKIYSLYGSAETGIWGWSTYSEKETSFGVLDDIIIEIDKKNEKGDGAIVVTNLLRKRFPVFRYLMGDVGCLNYVNNKRVLTLKSRESKSFSVDSESYFLDDFDWLYKIVDRFQIQISLISPVETDITFLLIKENQPINEENKKLNKIRNELIQIFDVNAEIITLSLNFVEESALYMNNTTSKTPTFVDFRN
jgi:phenylacetate-CoA ligase